MVKYLIPVVGVLWLSLHSYCVKCTDISSGGNSIVADAVQSSPQLVGEEWFVMSTGNDSKLFSNRSSSSGPFGIMSLAQFVASKAMEGKEIGKRDTPLGGPSRLPVDDRSSDRYLSSSREIEMDKPGSVRGSSDFPGGDRIQQGFNPPEMRDPLSRNAAAYPYDTRNNNYPNRSPDADPMRGGRPWQDDTTSNRGVGLEDRYRPDDSRRFDDRGLNEDGRQMSEDSAGRYGDKRLNQSGPPSRDNSRSRFEDRRSGSGSYDEVSKKDEYYSRQSTVTEDRRGRDDKETDERQDKDRRTPDRREPRKGRFIHRIVIRNKNICPPCYPQSIPYCSPTQTSPLSTMGLTQGSNPYYAGYK